MSRMTPDLWRESGTRVISSPKFDDLRSGELGLNYVDRRLVIFYALMEDDVAGHLDVVISDPATSSHVHYVQVFRFEDH